METLFREVTRRICGSLQIDEALFDVYVYLKGHLPLNGICITVYEYETKSARIIAGAYDSGGILVNRSFPISDTAWRTVQKWQKESRSETTPWIRDETHPINNEIKKVMTHFANADYFKRLEHFSSITCALKIRDEIIGNLTFVGFGPDRYSTSHGNIITEVNEPFAIALSNALRFMELEQNNRELQKEARKVKGDVMIGADGGLKKVKHMIEQVAPTLSHVLLQGETGTGKEVVANEIHKLSPRSNGPLISLNCGAIPENLIDSELFGHEKGSFTGAVETRQGLFERADKGTLFLDEVGELPLSAQTKLLRVIQTGEFERVGGTFPVKCDVRLICATHRNLENMVQKKEFREDLWYRLNVFPITIPPLRRRTRDIPLMVEHFILTKCKEMNIATPPKIASGELKALTDYPWPGNVRELQNLIERALILSKGNPLTFPDLIHTNRSKPGEPQVAHKINPGLDDTIAEHIKWALTQTNGKISGKDGAAELLEINPNTLRSRMQKLNIKRSSSYTRK
ncbi:MAG: sigma-54-dependent Fis family transcriptional regulator [Desulfobacterales bacterium]|nr:sigma-54-dependent Fis family transcriptional regulator [Desulfobacterales bacterium]MCP4159736.1 sigma-54-dependent Fis family transcriptional regulator [Deltaproteobacteria bacterium]